MKTAETTRHANNFDFLRLVAAVIVIYSHSYLIAYGSQRSEPLVWATGNQCTLGLVGVFVFFIISGYLVTESYCRSPAPGRFAVRRVLRIYPGLVLNVLVCALLVGPMISTLPLGAYFTSAALRQFLIETLTLSPG